MNLKYEFVGNKVESLAKGYPKREYTHSETYRGKEVRYYDCYRIREDYVPDVFSGDELEKRKVSKVEKILGIKFKKK